MNTLVAVAIAPFGVGDELAPYMAEAVRIIRDSGLPHRTTSMFTEIEGSWDEVMAVVRDATMVLADQGSRWKPWRSCWPSSPGTARHFTSSRHLCGGSCALYSGRYDASPTNS